MGDGGVGPLAGGVRAARGWWDALIPFLLALAGGTVLLLGTRGASGIATAYLTHGWYLAIVGFWVLVLGRRFPVGRLSCQSLRGWFRPWLVVGGLDLLLTLASPGPPLRQAVLPTLAFQGVVVGPAEEFLFRGLMQTALNHAMPRPGPPLGLRRGTLWAALAFGLLHLGNLWYQPLGVTLEQGLFAFVVGLVLGHFYDRTRNLWGAAMLHNLLDLLSVAVPLMLAR